MSEYDFMRVGYVRIKRESEKAILVIIRHDSTISEHWIPKSVLGEFSEVKEEGDQGILVVKRWWFSKNDIPKADIVPGRDDGDDAESTENKGGGNKWPGKRTTVTASTSASASASVTKTIKKSQSTVYYYRMCSSSLNIEINDDGKIIETSVAPDTMKALADKFHEQYEDPSVGEFLTFLGGEEINFEVIEAIAVCF